MKWRFCNINQIPDICRKATYAALSPSKKARVDRQKNDKAKTLSVCAVWLLNSLLTEEFGIKDPVVSANADGMPYIEGEDIFVSISHSGDFVAVCASHAPIGIDIEVMRDINPRIFDKVCTDAEREYIENGDRTTRFFEIWTGKEAYFKMQGHGIRDLKSVNILTLDRKTDIRDGCFIQIVGKC